MKATTKFTLIGVLGLSLAAAAIYVQRASAQQAPPRGQRPQRQEGAPQGEAGGPRRPPPLIGALDANHDGVIDAAEIANASAALATLDKNGDGQLTPDEFAGPPPGPRGFGPGPEGAGFGPPKEILEKYDVNHDGKLDENERAALHQDIEDGKLPPPPGRRGPGGPPPADEQ